MNRFKNHIAVFLLLLFVRVLVPETVVLAMHTHEHTEDIQKKSDNGFKLDKKHTHCQTDSFFNKPYAPATLGIIDKPVLSFTDTYSANHSFIWKFTFPNNTDLRGPPLA